MTPTHRRVACLSRDHRPDWRVLERGYERPLPAGPKVPSEASTLICLQCVAVWRSAGEWVDRVPDFARRPGSP